MVDINSVSKEDKEYLAEVIRGNLQSCGVDLQPGQAEYVVTYILQALIPPQHKMTLNGVIKMINEMEEAPEVGSAVDYAIGYNDRKRDILCALDSFPASDPTMDFSKILEVAERNYEAYKNRKGEAGQMLTEFDSFEYWVAAAAFDQGLHGAATC